MARPLALALLIASSLVAQQARMARVPEGDFAMGRAHELPDDGLKWVPHILRDDRPVHRVFLAAFEIDVHEVTNRQYHEFVTVRAGSVKAPYYWPEGRPPAGREDDPVANVTWHEADAFCRWRGGRLPSEAEWEKACRGGAESQRFPWGDAEVDRDRAHYDSVTGPTGICGSPANAYGLCDMAGNVWEWSADFYARDYYSKAPEHGPTGPPEGPYRVLRGGSWADVPKFLTCAHRSFARPQERSPNVGFRCAKSAD